MTPTLHIAGPLGPDRIQRCARCYLPLKDFRRLAIDVPQGTIPVAVTYGLIYSEGSDVEVGLNYQAMILTVNPDAQPCRVTEIGSVVDELTYRSYREQRRLSPHVSPERWQAVYLNALNLETRYQDEQAGNALLVAAFGAGVLS